MNEKLLGRTRHQGNENENSKKISLHIHQGNNNQKTGNGKFWYGCREDGILVDPLWKTLAIPQKVKYAVTIGSRNSPKGMKTNPHKNLSTNVHSSIIPTAKK